MAMVLDAFINNFSVILANAVEEEEIMVLGVNNEIQTLLKKIRSFQSLLGDAEKRKFAEPCIDQWLSELKDVMYDADDTIDICKIEGAKLLENQNHNSKTTMFYIISSLVDPLVVGREVDVAANELVNLLITEKVEEKCRVLVITGMEGVGKTNNHEIENYFNVKAWACVTQTYSEIDLLKLIIRAAKGSYGNANTKLELQPILRDSVTSCQSLFLVLDDVWMANVWIDSLQVPLDYANISF
ncbi:hypothetical protein IEQ34_001030 [Dendrobium chrysotoxum]|uniref:Uncharacterized protein n=1 Tax=Dendrobium chrysotoxum TaxID=161865 RepID=A0AAV7HP41_DENCH|nr:hypothetical protein IEQ34_001030 [Dendrobium chrysotoxum]